LPLLKFQPSYTDGKSVRAVGLMWKQQIIALYSVSLI